MNWDLDHKDNFYSRVFALKWMVKSWSYRERSDAPIICGVKNGVLLLLPICAIAIKPLVLLTVVLPTFYFIVIYFFRQGLMYPGLVSKLLCSQGWPWALGSASTSQVLGLQACATTLHLHGTEAQTQCFAYASKDSCNWTTSLVPLESMLKDLFNFF